LINNAKLVQHFGLTLQTENIGSMKKIHIALLVMIAVAIAVLVSFMKTTSTFDSIDFAIANPGKFMHIMAKLDKSVPVEYDPVKNPNYLVFTAKDSTGTMKVVYNNSKPENFEMSSSLALKGKFKDGEFHCTGILPKCPSKYKDAQENGQQHPDSIKIN
jgi:cytochrome c-type biogenesis protein CcmE